MQTYIPTSRSETTTTTTTLPARRIGRSRRNIFDTADLHTGTGEGAESGLSAWTGSFCAVSACGADLNVEGCDAEFLAADGDVLGGQHGGVGGGLVTVGFDFHSAGDTTDGFAAG